MKVLVIVHGYPPGAVGGTELYAETHATHLHCVHGDDVTVLTRENDSSRAEHAVRTELRDGIRVAFINNTYGQTRSFEDTYASTALGAVAERIIDEAKPDVAHIHHLTHLSTAIVDVLARRHIPTVMTLHDYWLICHRGQLLDAQLRVCDGPGTHGCESCVGVAGGSGPLAFAGAAAFRRVERSLPLWLRAEARRAAEAIASSTRTEATASWQSLRRTRDMRRVCEQIDHFFAPSRCLRDRFIAFGIAPERITWSPYGLDHARFAPGPDRSRPERHTPPVGHTRPVRPLRVAFFGSLMASKAPHLLLQATAVMPQRTVSVDLFGAVTPYHGDHSYAALLRDGLRDRADVRMHGAVEHARVPALLQTADVVVVPSIWPENSPFVIHEAQLAGVPVVAARIGGIPELVEHGRNGLLFEPGNAVDLRCQLERLVGEAGLLDAMRGTKPTVRTVEDDVSRMRERYRRRPVQRGRPRLAAIVLNFQTPDETLLAVKALLQSDRRVDDVIVVNNGRDDEHSQLRACLESVASAVTVLHTGENLGFSGGMNAGITTALARGAERALLVNSDVIVPPDCIARLEGALDRHPGLGIVGPVMVARTDPGTVASLGIGYSRTTGRMRHHEFGARLADTPVAPVRHVDAVSGCVMLIRREVMSTIGLLDETYFFSFEDVDFCIRARDAGFASAIVGAARVHHEGHRTIGHTTPARLYFAARNHLMLARRHCGSSLPFGLTAVPVITFNLAHAVRTGGGSLPARLAAVCRGTWDYAMGRFGAGAESARLTP